MEGEASDVRTTEHSSRGAVALPPPMALPPTPAGLREVNAPDDNPITPEKVELGWKLFFDMRLSKDGTMACVECHRIERAYASANILDGTVAGATNQRNSPAVTNVGYQTSFFWDGKWATVEAVCEATWKGQLDADPATVADRLNEVPVYRAMFERAFGEAATPENVPLALAAWLRALKNGNSPWDRFKAGDASALSKEAQDGMKVFEVKGCGACHVPPLFTDDDFHNAGIGDDPGRRAVTRSASDSGKFRTPSLRNVALTAPYFHDGHVTTLEDAIALMAKGGNPNPRLDANLRPRKLTPREASALKAFLESLTGESTFVTEPKLP
jgi:cytochrome c peroxidase